MKRPGESIMLNLVRYDHRVRWPCGVTSLDHFRTVAFEHSAMRQTIEFGYFPVRDEQRPWVHESFGPILGTWLAVVPECYREKVIEIVESTFDSTLKGQLFREWHRDQFIKELRDALYEKLEPIMPGDVRDG